MKQVRTVIGNKPTRKRIAGHTLHSSATSTVSSVTAPKGRAAITSHAIEVRPLGRIYPLDDHVGRDIYTARAEVKSGRARVHSSVGGFIDSLNE